jgi:hypothetical protein
VGQDFPQADVYLPISDVAGMLGIELANLPAKVPYVFPPADLAAAWKREFQPVRELKVGIAWQGNVDNKGDAERSIPLRHFRELTHTPGTCFYSLQFGTGREQIAQCDCKLIDLADRLGQFHQTAAAVQNLDLVITCDSSPGHLAGALGVPTWIALAHYADWRWMTERSDSPWYPATRLFRQSKPGEWEPVFQRIKTALEELLAQRAVSAS